MFIFFIIEYQIERTKLLEDFDILQSKNFQLSNEKTNLENQIAVRKIFEWFLSLKIKVWNILFKVYNEKLVNFNSITAEEKKLKVSYILAIKLC